MFRQYVEHRNADLVLYDKQEWFNSKKTLGLNVFNMVRRSGCGLMYISGEYTQLAKAPASAAVLISPMHSSAPASLKYQFASLEEKLDAMENAITSKKVVSRKINHLSRYFLNESTVDKMLSEANASLLLLKS